MRFELFTLAILCFSSVKSDDELKISTLNGPVQGVKLDFDSRYQQTPDPQNTSYSIRAWLGIPYAKKPLNDLRFKRPEAVDNWTEVINATKFQPDCYKPEYDRDISEDCLYLNIWAPFNASNAAVMVIK